jgi:pyridoxal phosphate enzyme (YggS family)
MSAPSAQDPSSRYAAVLAAIDQAAKAAGRSPAEVRLLAVSKTHPPAAISDLYELGQRAFAENYAQELAAKAEALAALPDLRFEFIGTLQSNKLALIVRTAAAIQSLGSERHARLLARHVKDLGRAPYPVHLLVNAGDEATKSGLARGEVEAVARVITAELPELRLRGVMAIPPPLPPGSAGVPPLYRELRALASRVGDGELSLGMSGDLAAAIAAGAGCVRIGTALFGARGKP